MHGVVADDRAPGLPVHGRRRETHQLQRLSHFARLAGREGRVKAAAEKQLLKGKTAVGLDALAHHALAQRHLCRRTAERADAGHDLALAEPHRALKGRTIHRPGDPGRAETLGNGVQNHALKGKAEGLLGAHLAAQLARNIGIRAGDDRAGELLRLRVEHAPFDGQGIGRLDRRGIAQDIVEQLPVRRGAVKAAHAPAAADQFRCVHMIFPPALLRCASVLLTFVLRVEHGLDRRGVFRQPLDRKLLGLVVGKAQVVL